MDNGQEDGENQDDEQHFISHWGTILFLFLLFPLAVLWLPAMISTPDETIQVEVPEPTPVLIIGTGMLLLLSGLFIIDWIRVQRHDQNNSTSNEDTILYKEEYHTARSLASSLITSTGVFISLLGTGAFFGTDRGSPSSALIVMFAMLVLAGILGFFSLSELSTGVIGQSEQKVTMNSGIWLRFWYYAKYTLLTLIVAVTFLTIELVVS